MQIFGSPFPSGQLLIVVSTLTVMITLSMCLSVWFHARVFNREFCEGGCLPGHQNKELSKKNAIRRSSKNQHTVIVFYLKIPFSFLDYLLMS